MFIICPKCSAKYKIPEGTTLENGQKLKCSACGHLFEKGEEAPFTLEEPIIANEAFTEPLYTASDLRKEETKQLPEAFQPVSNETNTKSSLWIIPFYIILLALLCIAGWQFRDLLKPSFSNVIIPKTEVSISKPIPAPIKPKPEVSSTPSIKAVEATPSQKPFVDISEPIASDLQVKHETTPSEPQQAPVALQEQVPESLPPLELIPDDKPLFEAIPTSTPSASQDTASDNVPPFADSPLNREDTLFESAVVEIGPSIQTDITHFKTDFADSNVLQLLVEGKISNLTAEIQKIPALTIYAYDLKNKLVVQKEIHLTKPQLNPHEVLPFYTSIIPVPQGIARIEAHF